MGTGLGSGSLDEPTSADGCKRERDSVQVLTAGSLEPGVGVMVRAVREHSSSSGRRCDGLVGQPYWDCLLRAARLREPQLHADSAIPLRPSPRGEVPLGGSLGRAWMAGRSPSDASLASTLRWRSASPAGRATPSWSPRSVPTRCSRADRLSTTCSDVCESPVWFTFDPPGGQVGETVVARGDRELGRRSTVRTSASSAVPIATDFVPTQSSAPAPVGRVGKRVDVRRSRPSCRPLRSGRVLPAVCGRLPVARLSSPPARSS